MKALQSRFGTVGARLWILAVLLPLVALAQYSTSNYREQGGARWVIGGSLDVASGGDLDVESGGALKIAGTAMSASAAELNVLDGVTAGTVTASKACVVSAGTDLAGLGNVTIAGITGNDASLGVAGVAGAGGGAGGAIAAVGGLGHTNGAGGAITGTGGGGAGTGAGGAITLAGGASGAGATGNGGAGPVCERGGGGHGQ